MPTSTHAIVEAACLAPSIHNTQPWSWRVGADTLELRADRDRQLEVADPRGRSLMISCGAALHHAQVAARALGWSPTVARLPDPGDQDLLAVVGLEQCRPAPSAIAELRALEQRRTDRRRFTSWPVPDQRLLLLAGASDRGAHAIPITDVTSRFRVEMLVNRAMTKQDSDEQYAVEQMRWIDHSLSDGVPASAIPPVSYYPRNHRTRYGHGLYPDAPQEVVESSDGLMAVCTEDDQPLSWLTAGEVLSSVWLLAIGGGLSVVPLSQVIEVEETRLSLHHDVFGGKFAPQILLRIGWQEIGRSGLQKTPRRPLDEVILP